MYVEKALMALGGLGVPIEKSDFWNRLVLYLISRFHPQCANFFKEKETKFSIVPFDHLKEPLHNYIMNIKTQLEHTMKALYLAKKPEITEDDRRPHEESQLAADFLGNA